MIKKLAIAALAILAPSLVHAFSPVRYVQISTNTLSRQSGAISISTASINVSSMTSVYTSTLTVTSSATIFSANIDNETVRSSTMSLVLISTVTASSATFTNVSASSVTASIVGTTTNNNANPGAYGYSVSSVTTANVNFPTTAQYGDLLSISLGSGDWFCMGQIFAQRNGATLNDVELGISATSGNSGSGLVAGDSYMSHTGVAISLTIIPVTVLTRVSISATTTYYLKFYGDYTVATPLARGKLFCWKPR